MYSTLPLDNTNIESTKTRQSLLENDRNGKIWVKNMVKIFYPFMPIVYKLEDSWSDRGVICYCITKWVLALECEMVQRRQRLG